MEVNNLEKMLEKHEGLRLKPYKCTQGKWTIGIGHNYEDNPFTLEEITEILNKGFTREIAYKILYRDIQDSIRELHRFKWFDNLDAIRQDALIDMHFNMGLDTLLRFKKMIAALEIKDFRTAKLEALDSTWRSQVGRRADEVADMIETGQYA